MVSPRSALTPLPDMNAKSSRSPWSACSVPGPTSAWMDRRSIPPVTTTSIWFAMVSASATSRELVTTVSSPTRGRSRARLNVVVPGPSTMESPGLMSSRARSAMACFSAGQLPGLLRVRRFVRQTTGEHGSAPGPAHHPRRIERPQVPPDGRFRRAQLSSQVMDRDDPHGPERLDDLLATFGDDHARTVQAVTTRDRSCTTPISFGGGELLEGRHASWVDAPGRAGQGGRPDP